MALNRRQRRFVYHYCACLNATEAAKLAGYSHCGQQGHRLLKKAEIIKAIEASMRRAENHIIASAEERKEVLTEMMQSAQVRDADRCKAIEILNKMEGLDIRKHEVVAQLKLSPEEAERRAVEIYKGNPELWERIKSAVEGVQEPGDEG